MGLLLTLFYGLLGASFLRPARRGFANPVVIFFLLWSLIFFLYEFRSWLAPDFDLSGYSPATFSFYLKVGIAVSTGAFLSILFENLLPKRKNARDVAAPMTLPVTSYNPPIAVLLAYASFVLALIALLQAPYSIKDYLSIGGQIRSALTLSYNPLGSLASMLSSYAAYLAIVPAFIALYAGHRKKVWPYLPIVACLVVSLISIAKYTVIQFAVLALAVYLCVNQVTVRNILPFAKKLLLVLVAMSFIFLATDFLRGNSNKAETETHSRITSIMFMYGVGHINTFSIFYSNMNESGESTTRNAGFSNYTMTTEPEFGERTFSSIYRVFYWMGLKDNPSYTRYEGVKGFNTASIYRPLLEDFGVHGAYGAMFFLGFILQLATRLSIQRSPQNIALLSYIILFTVFTPIHSLFNFIYFLLCLMCAGFVARNIKFRSPRLNRRAAAAAYHS